MKKSIENNMSLFLKIFILMQPFIDLLTGICVQTLNFNFTFGIIIRVFALLLIMTITVFVYKKRSALYVYLALGIYAILYVLGILLYKDGVGLFREIQGVIKVIYFPILLYSMYVLKDDLEIKLDTLYKTLIIYTLLIFIPSILNIGFKTYEITKSGSLGFFNSANEISGIISILTPVLFLQFNNKKNLLLKIIFLFIYLYTILNMGTKTPLLSLLITIGVSYLYLIYNFIKLKKYKQLSLAIGIILLGILSLILIIPRTNFYKNIKVHLDFLEVENITEVFTDYKLIDHFIFSQRLTFLENEYKIYKDSPMYLKLFGVGYIQDGKETKLIEMDYFDIALSHGIIGFLLLFCIYIYVVYKLLKEKTKWDFKALMIFTSIFLIIILSLFSGHILIAPSVNMIVVSIYILEYKVLNELKQIK